MRERLMVRGSKYWIADKDGKVLVSYHDSKEEAKEALSRLEKKEIEEGYYIPYFYKIVEGMLSRLRCKGYVPLDDLRVISEM